MVREEKNLLEDMLNQHKISNEEYKLLSNALENKSSLENVSSFLINPFQRLAGVPALFVGILIIIASSILGVFANLYFDGIASCSIASSFKNTGIQPSFLFLLYQNFVSWLVLALFYLLMARLFNQKGVRIIDIFSTVALARFPYLILTGILAIVMILKPSLYQHDPSKTYKLYPSIFIISLDLIWELFYVWLLAIYFSALKESTGLLGKKLWFSFLISIIVGQIASFYLCRTFI